MTAVRPNVTKLLLALIALLVVALVALLLTRGEAPPPPAVAQPIAPPPGAPNLKTDRDVFGYYLGIPVFLRARVPPFLGGDGPAAPSRKVPDLIVYVTAPTSSDAAFHAPSARIKTPQGERYLPPHEDTLTRFVDASSPADALGYFVVAGPQGTPDRVRVLVDPGEPDTSRYLSGAPLASAILVGNQWLPLNSHIVINYGLRAGLLKLRYFDYGGLMWADWQDENIIDMPREVVPAYSVALPQQTD